MVLKNGEILEKDEFTKERDLQSYFEKHLKEILKLTIVCSEFSVGKYRIDSLAFDEETKAFKIIEFKNIKNRSLVDQGYTYLKVLHERKADFVLKYNETKNKNLKISDVDWSQSRIIFVSPVFTNYQIDATSFKNLPFDLFKVNKYENNIVLIDPINKTSDVKIVDINNNFDNEVLKEIKVYTEEDHLRGKPRKIVEMYDELKEEILGIGDIEIAAMKYYIAFKSSRNIVDLEVQHKNIRVNINLKKGELEDSRQLSIDQSNIGHWGNGDYELLITDTQNLEYIMSLVKQAL